MLRGKAHFPNEGADRCQTPEITVGEMEAGTARFSDWPSLAAYLMRDTGDSGYIWRGQGDANWGLVSSLERAFIAGKVDDSQRDDREQQALSYFRAHAKGYLDSTPPEGDIGRLAGSYAALWVSYQAARLDRIPIRSRILCLL